MLREYFCFLGIKSQQTDPITVVNYDKVKAVHSQPSNQLIYEDPCPRNGRRHAGACHGANHKDQQSPFSVESTTVHPFGVRAVVVFIVCYVAD